METAQTLLILTNLPDEASAHRLAARLVDDRLAACVSIMAPCTSVYRWQGAVETAQEWPLMIKTAAARLPALKETLVRMHPYELPELIALPVVDALPGYLGWALGASAPEDDAAAPP